MRRRFTAVVALATALVAVTLVGTARPARVPETAGLIAFSRHDGIYEMRADGSGVRALRRGGVAAGAVGLAWSPDGRKLAFIGYEVGEGSGIWVMNGSGRNLRRVVDMSTTSSWPLGFLSWSPDGKRIAFTAAQEGQGGSDLWVVSAAGGETRRLVRTPGRWEIEVDWSSDGRIAVSAGVWFFRIDVMNADGSKRHRISPPAWVGAQEGSPVWSPDGRRLAFVRWDREVVQYVGEDPDSDIWVMKPNGTSRVRLTRNTVMDRDPVWSPDGSKIAFIRWGGRNGPINIAPAKLSTSEIFVMNADGTGVTRLTNNKLGEGSLAWQAIPRAAEP